MLKEPDELGMAWFKLHKKTCKMLPVGSYKRSGCDLSTKISLKNLVSLFYDIKYYISEVYQRHKLLCPKTRRATKTSE